MVCATCPRKRICVTWPRSGRRHLRRAVSMGQRVKDPRGVTGTSDRVASEPEGGAGGSRGGSEKVCEGRLRRQIPEEAELFGRGFTWDLQGAREAWRSDMPSLACRGPGAQEENPSEACWVCLADREGKLVSGTRVGGRTLWMRRSHLGSTLQGCSHFIRSSRRILTTAQVQAKLFRPIPINLETFAMPSFRSLKFQDQRERVSAISSRKAFPSYFVKVSRKFSSMNAYFPTSSQEQVPARMHGTLLDQQG